MSTSWLCRLLAVTCLLLAAYRASADVLEGRVTHIADGDTLTVLTNSQSQVKVRLAGIDAPERGQPFGERSKQNLARLVAGKLVEVRWHKRDRYGRVVGQVWVVSPDARCQGAGCPKTLDAGLAQLTVGLAWHFNKYAHEQSAEDRERYAFAEVEARARRAGLWRDPAPVAAWGWRRGRRGLVSGDGQRPWAGVALRAVHVRSQGGVPDVRQHLKTDLAGAQGPEGARAPRLH